MGAQAIYFAKESIRAIAAMSQLVPTGDDVELGIG
jgi:hypothetical protein